ncbi:MAG: response regulator receiver domain [Rhodobacteraceae bacterium]|nr:response regulator receiver domain [Paracoccaceae bacterium]
MDSAEENCGRKIAQRFLRTAVVVDDQAYILLAEELAKPGLKVPGRHTRASSQNGQDAAARGLIHSLDAGAVMDAFSALGIICGVVNPNDDAMETVRQADIVIIDWLLRDGKPDHTIKLIQELFGCEDRNSLRLLAIYTGETNLKEISVKISGILQDADLDPVMTRNDTSILYRHGQVVLYAKSGVNLANELLSRRVPERELPGKLVEDFASMTAGLLPAIGLTSLTAVREGTHKVLDQFSADLDPAYLAHRACLSNAEDAEHQIVAHVAEEFRGLMDSMVAEESPAGAKKVEEWVKRKGRELGEFTFGKEGKQLNIDETIALANQGLDASPQLKRNAFESLSDGFAGSNTYDLDERLAWIMSFRTVYNTPSPTLWLGTIVTAISDNNEQHLICMRPRCDCVRLTGLTKFLFLPLVDPRKEMDQIVVRIEDEYKRLGINGDPDGWQLIKFKPVNGSNTVSASADDDGLKFKDLGGVEYTWRGELKAEYAQRIAQNFGEKLSRVAIDESEWLRRSARKQV